MSKWYEGQELKGSHAELKEFIRSVSEAGGYVKLVSSDTARVEVAPPAPTPKKSKSAPAPEPEPEPVEEDTPRPSFWSSS